MKVVMIEELQLIAESIRMTDTEAENTMESKFRTDIDDEW